MKRLPLTFAFLLSWALSYSQLADQTIRGVVVDKDSQFPVIGASVILVNSDPINGTITDINGEFTIEGVTPGRHALKVSFVGYYDVTLPSVNVLTGKGTYLNLEMEESTTALDEVVVYANEDKAEINNEMALISARGFNLDETMRYAGALNDPSRMAANFAGVASANDGRNDIIIRGNSPTGLLWRLEDLDIPNPNHYAAAGTTGGPVTILNNNQLANSDFMTSAFPAEYGNASSGVFDLKLRNGNNQKHEFLGQVSFNGFEFGAEGPFSKNSRASYMVNYRYSTLALAREVGFDFGTGAAVPQYQDISYKVNVPTKKGKLTFFGIAGTSYIELLGSEQDLESEDLFGSETEDIYNDNSLSLFGTSYTHFFSKKTFGKVVMGYSTVKEATQIDSITYNNFGGIDNIYRQQNIENKTGRLTTHLFVNSKLNRKNTLVAGTMIDLYNYNMFHDFRIPDTDTFFTNRSFNGNSSLFRAYAQWKHKFTNRLVFSTGLSTQYFEFANSSGVDPRASLSYRVGNKSTLSLGYGLHHQMQPLPLYFQEELQEDGSTIRTNEELGFVKSHHYVLGYDQMIFPDLRLKAEVYYQQINGAGIDAFNSSFSTLNFGADFDIPDRNNLVAAGEGKNMGIELTLEKFFDRQYYFLVTSSFFDSQYKGSDNLWRNTAFNGQYVINALAGKEWTFGPRSNTLSLDFSVTAAGGRYVTPIDLQASQDTGFEVRDEANAFSQKMNDYLRADVKVLYRLNRPKLTHEIGLEIQNVTNNINDFRTVYNRRTGEIQRETQVGFFPIPLYRIYF